MKQTIQVPFANGVDTGTDPLQVPFGTLLDLENGQFIQGGAINKRFGYDVLNNQTQEQGTISVGQSLAVFNEQLLAFDGYSMYSYMQGSQNWATVGPCISTIVSDSQITRTNEASQANPDSNICNGFQCVAWEDSRGGIWYSVIDIATNTQPVHEVPVNSAGYAPKVLVFNNLFVIFYMLGDILNYQLVNPFNPAAITSPVELHTDGYFSTQFGAYDASVIGSKIFLVYLNGSREYKLYSLNQAWTMSSEQAITSALTLHNTNFCCNVVGDSLENVYVHYTDGYSLYFNLGAYNVDQTGGFIFFGGDELEANCGQINTITCAPVIPYTGSGQFYTFYEVNATNPQYQQTHIANVIFGVGATIAVQRGVGLASKALLHDSVAYVNIVQDTALQATYFTMDQSQNLIAKIANEVGGTLITNCLLPEISAQGSTYTFANLIKGKIESQNNTLFTPLGVNVSTVDFNNVSSFLNAELSQNLFIVGGILQCYDGVNICEAGFHIYPENLVAEVSATGGYLFAGSYQYSAVYARTDNFGQINYSATAVPVTVNTVGAGTSAVQLQIPTLKLTAGIGTTILVYRTLVNQSNLYRITSFLGIPNDPTVDYITFVDTAPDSAIQTNDLLYITGGVLDNIAPPSSSIICTYNNRVFLSGLEDPNLIWYSQNKSDNTNENTIPTEFCSELTIGVNSLGGPITALLAMDANLIIFKETNTYYMSGLGPDATGNNSDYQDAVLITTDTGCNNVSSVVLMPQGIMFQSPKGIYLLDRSLTPHYIGKPVQAYNDQVVTSATLDNTSNQVIFTTHNGPTLVYNYLYNQWGIWTNILTESQGGIMWDNAFTFIKPNGLVYTQDQTAFTDGGIPIALSWETANISLAQLQGYQMIYSIYLEGQFKSPHTLTVGVAYNNNPAYTEFFNVIPSNNPQGYGDGYYGDGYYGGVYYPYQFRINPSQKRCSSIRIQVSDNQSAPNYGEGYSISNMLIVVGILPLANRIPGTGQTQ